MSELFNVLFRQTWWKYPPQPSWLDLVYHWFNLVEGSAWVVFGGLVLVRHWRHRGSPLEVVYAIAFFTFALTDFREAWYQQSWLLWIKLVNLIGLFLIRRRVMREFYPEARLY